MVSRDTQIFLLLLKQTYQFKKNKIVFFWSYLSNIKYQINISNIFELCCGEILQFELLAWVSFKKNLMDLGLRLGQNLNNFWNGPTHISAMMHYLY